MGCSDAHHGSHVVAWHVISWIAAVVRVYRDRLTPSCYQCEFLPYSAPMCVIKSTCPHYVMNGRYRVQKIATSLSSHSESSNRLAPFHALLLGHVPRVLVISPQKDQATSPRPSSGLYVGLNYPFPNLNPALFKHGSLPPLQSNSQKETKIGVAVPQGDADRLVVWC
jgi:hypothetical protein